MQVSLNKTMRSNHYIEPSPDTASHILQFPLAMQYEASITLSQNNPLRQHYPLARQYAISNLVSLRKAQVLERHRS